MYDRSVGRGNRSPLIQAACNPPSTDFDIYFILRTAARLLWRCGGASAGTGRRIACPGARPLALSVSGEITGGDVGRAALSFAPGARMVLALRVLRASAYGNLEIKSFIASIMTRVNSDYPE